MDARILGVAQIGPGLFFWVPGTWVQPPQPELLWTPPYWSQVDGGYAFHGGYWAAEVGFYGGIDYGYGYAGDGYQGGRWENGVFFYNRAVNNLGSLGYRTRLRPRSDRSRQR